MKILILIYAGENRKVGNGEEYQMDNRSLSYTCWKWQYHTIFIPKYCAEK